MTLTVPGHIADKMLEIAKQNLLTVDDVHLILLENAIGDYEKSEKELVK